MYFRYQIVSKYILIKRFQDSYNLRLKQSLDFCKSYFCTGCQTCVLTNLPVIQLMISNTFLVRLMQQLFLLKHLITKFYILCVISVKCTVWILKWLLNPMIILILFLMVGRYTFLKFEKNNINSIFKDV